MNHDEIRDAYHRALSSTLVISEGQLDQFSIKGTDRLDLLERLSSNTFKGREPGDHVPTTLLEPNGRLIDLLNVFILEDSLELAVGQDNAGRVGKWLREHIFFQDDVNLEGPDSWSSIITILGPGADDLLGEKFGAAPKFERNQFHLSQQALILPLLWPNVSGYRVYAQTGGAAEHLSALLDPLSSVAPRQAVEALRIEAGVPKRAHEIRPGLIPLELRLRETISFNKGCYIGQEVIARLESRGELAAGLKGVMLTAHAERGSSLEQAGREIGALTSCAFSPEHGWIGLGLVKTRRWDTSQDDIEILGSPVRVTDLPFGST